MAERYLIDTSAVIKYLNGSLPEKGLSFMDAIVDEESNISFVSEIELQVWNPPNPTDLEIYHSFVFGSAIIGITPDIIRETIRIRKTYKIKLPDSLIAATALVNDLTLLSDNDVDFGKIVGLKYLNPVSIK